MVRSCLTYPITSDEHVEIADQQGGLVEWFY